MHLVKMDLTYYESFKATCCAGRVILPLKIINAQNDAKTDPKAASQEDSDQGHKQY